MPEPGIPCPASLRHPCDNKTDNCEGQHCPRYMLIHYGSPTITLTLPDHVERVLDAAYRVAVADEDLDLAAAVRRMAEELS